MTLDRKVFRILVAPLVVAAAMSTEAEPGTSEDSSKFASFLAQNPEADANGDGVLTVAEWGTFIRNERSLPPPDVPDFSYGDHPMQTFDLWLPKNAKQPVPLVLYIHSGGFSQGYKAQIRDYTIEHWTEEFGIACASLSYRLTPEVSFPDTHLDCARALQTLRHHAGEWNIDPTRVASSGSSAGAGITLWLAFNDDLADPDSDDPVARQSTRLTCAIANDGQTSYDPRFAERIGLPRFESHGFFFPFFGIKREEFDLPKAHHLYEEASAIAHLTEDDPPVWMRYRQPNEPITEASTASEIVHHPLFGIELQRKMNELDIECFLTYTGSENRPLEKPYEFVRRHLVK